MFNSLLIIAFIILCIVLAYKSHNSVRTIGGSLKQFGLIFHIAGAPGSGKTWVGDYIKKKFPEIEVYDTDFILKYNDLMDECDKMIKKDDSVYGVDNAGGYFVNKYNAVIDKIIEKNNKKRHPKNILFVGLPNYNYLDKMFASKLSQIADYKYFINISLEALAKNVLYRNYINPLCGNKKFIDALIKGKQGLSAFHKDYTTDGYMWLKDKYLPLGYKDLSQLAINNAISKNLF